MNDELGIRIKENYENRTRYYLPRRTYTLLRLDGKSFHTYTRGLQRPFDKGLSEDMDAAVIAMLPEIQGAVFAYLQSDECSILLTDFEKPATSAWFDGNIQKMSSVAASIMTAEFNHRRILRAYHNLSSTEKLTPHQAWDCVSVKSLANFDCRCFSIPDRIEVMNYLRWRQQDCIRNSVSMVAQNTFNHKELHGKSQSDMHEMLHSKSVNWATDFTDGEKNGRVIRRVDVQTSVSGLPKKQQPETFQGNFVWRKEWRSEGAWVFTKDEGKLLNMIPKYE